MDPSPYQDGADPIILGLEVSDGGSSEGSGVGGLSGTSVAADTSEEEKSDTKRRRRRLSLSSRWSTAEQREEQRRAEQERALADESDATDTDEDDVEADSIDVDAPRQEIRQVSAALQQSVQELQYTVEANKQIAEQERLQLQQDIEVSAMHAAARYTGEYVQAPPPTRTFQPNPRLELATHRRVASTPGRAGETHGRVGVHTKRGTQGQSEAVEEWRTSRAGRESSRSRGRRPVR